MEETQFRVYKEEDKIVGIVDYQVFEKSEGESGSYETKLFSCDNKIAIRSLFVKNETIGEDIIVDLMKVYQKDIIISARHTDYYLKNIVKKLNGRFNFCEYILKD